MASGTLSSISYILPDEFCIPFYFTSNGFKNCTRSFVISSKILGHLNDYYMSECEYELTTASYFEGHLLRTAAGAEKYRLQYT